MPLPSNGGAAQPDDNGWSDMVAVQDNASTSTSVIAMGRGRLIRLEPPPNLDSCYETFMATCVGHQAQEAQGAQEDRCQQCAGRAHDTLEEAGCSDDMIDNLCA